MRFQYNSGNGVLHAHFNLLLPYDPPIRQRRATVRSESVSQDVSCTGASSGCGCTGALYSPTLRTLPLVVKMRLSSEFARLVYPTGMTRELPKPDVASLVMDRLVNAPRPKNPGRTIRFPGGVLYTKVGTGTIRARATRGPPTEWILAQGS